MSSNSDIQLTTHIFGDPERSEKLSVPKISKVGLFLVGEAKKEAKEEDNKKTKETYILAPYVYGLFDKESAVPVLPKGSIDKNESNMGCLYREFKEETGITLNEATLEKLEKAEPFVTILAPSKKGRLSHTQIHALQVDNIMELADNLKHKEHCNEDGSLQTTIVEIAKQDPKLPTEEQLLEALRTGKLYQDYSCDELGEPVTVLAPNLKHAPLLPIVEKLYFEQYESEAKCKQFSSPDQLAEALQKPELAQFRFDLHKQADLIARAMGKEGLGLISDDEGVKIATEGRIMGYILETARIVPLTQYITDIHAAAGHYPAYAEKIFSRDVQKGIGRISEGAQIDAVLQFGKCEETTIGNVIKVNEIEPLLAELHERAVNYGKAPAGIAA